MTLQRVRALILAALVINLPAEPAQSQAPALDRESVQVAIEQAKARLGLTPEQVAQIRPLMEEYPEKRRAEARERLEERYRAGHGPD